jgi:putative endonuclease
LSSYQLGRQAEDWVVQHLEQSGWRILARNFRGRRGEIDVVARQAEVIVFVEIKSSRHRPPLEALQPRQIGRLRAAAVEFLQQQRLSQDGEMRFDVFCVWGDPVQFEHLQDAF